MDADDRFTSDILAALSCLPFEQQAEGLRTAVSDALKHMSTQRLEATRRRIAGELDETLPVVRGILEMIDGQLALREVAAGAYWR
jgi:hypothetical protein